jgi:uncharacterized protein (DUF433 family)
MKPDRIEVHPKVMMGTPVIRGTRLTVEMIVRKLSEGATEALSQSVRTTPHVEMRGCQKYHQL